MAMLGNDTYNEILNKDMGIYKGAIYENIIAESFIKMVKICIILVNLLGLK